MEQTFDRRNYITRDWLLARSAELRERVRRVEEGLRGNREPLPADSSDAAIVVENDEVLKGIASAALDELHYIGIALKRLRQGDFAICEKCGAEIESERIEAAPYATRCARCARQG